MTDPFVGLHVHSAMSLSDGVSSPEEIARYVAESEMVCCALTDHGVLTGIFPFDKAMRDLGIHPLIGCEAYLTLGPTKRDGEAIADNFHQTILVRNTEGWKNLNHLMWRAYEENFYYKPRIQRDWFIAQGDGLVVLSGCIGSLINQAIIAATFPDTAEDGVKAVSSGAKARKKTGIEYGNLDAARAHFQWYHERFGDDFYVELMDHGMAEEHECARHLIAWAEQEGVTIVATNDSHYLRDEDYAMQRIITAGSRQGDEDGGIGHAGLSLKTGAAMLDLPLFREYPRAVANTALVAAKCVDFVLPKPTNLLPQFPLPAGETDVDSYLWKAVVAGATQRYGHFSGAIKERATYEFGVVKKMLFCDYFAVVADFIQWAKRQGIRCGPARGSAAGSLIVYALGITDVDPLAYGLIFERFLNEGRISLPDIDADFSDDRRAEVVQYVIDKYGADKVAGIATFGTLQAASAIKAVGRAKDLTFDEQNTLSKLFPNKAGAPPMVEAVQAPAVQAYLATLSAPDRARMDEVLAIAIQVNGRTNSMGRHAAGIVISREPLVDHLPVMISKGERLVGVTMGWAEELGLLKMDFLGLKTLTVMERAEALIARRTGTPFSVDSVPLDDGETYALLRRGDLTGIFQIEGGTGTLCTQMIAPTTLDDIIAVMALGRPGPMDHAPAFAARKHGLEPIVYPHSDLEAVLGATQGFALFQEQVMEIARLLADYTLTEADELRKAMGKKLPAAMAKHRERFVTGCAAKGIDGEAAHALFDELEKFSGYGFNKSHSVGYALIAYRTAYLSAHYPCEFLAALITSEFGDGDRTAAIIAAAKHRGITILPPSVNHSQRDCTIEGEAIRLGLGLIKGVGEAVARRIAAHAPYVRFDHLLLAGKAHVNTGVLKALILAGACDDLLPGENRLRLPMAEAVDPLGKETSRRLALKRNSWNPWVEESALPHGPWLPSRLAPMLTAEKGVLGCYLTMDPLVELAAREGAGAPLAAVPEYADDADLPTDIWQARRYLVEARIVKVIETKVKKELMAICEVVDAAETTRSLTIFPRLYAALGGLDEGMLLRVTARPERYNGKIQLIAEAAAVIDLEMVEAAIEREEARKGAVLHLAPSAYQLSQPAYGRFFHATLERSAGEGAVMVVVHYPNGERAAEKEGVTDPQAVAARLHLLFGGDRVLVGAPDLVWRDGQFCERL